MFRFYLASLWNNLPTNLNDYLNQILIRFYVVNANISKKMLYGYLFVMFISFGPLSLINTLLISKLKSIIRFIDFTFFINFTCTITISLLVPISIEIICKNLIEKVQNIISKYTDRSDYLRSVENNIQGIKEEVIKKDGSSLNTLLELTYTYCSRSFPTYLQFTQEIVRTIKNNALFFDALRMKSANNLFYVFAEPYIYGCSDYNNSVQKDESVVWRALNPITSIAEIKSTPRKL